MLIRPFTQLNSSIAYKQDSLNSFQIQGKFRSALISVDPWLKIAFSRPMLSSYPAIRLLSVCPLVRRSLHEGESYRANLLPSQ